MKANGNGLTKVIAFRISEEEYEIISKSASESNLLMGPWTRAIVTEAAKRGTHVQIVHTVIWGEK